MAFGAGSAATNGTDAGRRLYVTRLCPWLVNNDPTEGHDLGGPGLIFEALQEDPQFGSVQEWRWEDIRDFRGVGAPL